MRGPRLYSTVIFGPPRARNASSASTGAPWAAGAASGGAWPTLTATVWAAPVRAWHSSAMGRVIAGRSSMSRRKSLAAHRVSCRPSKRPSAMAGLLMKL